MTIRLTITYNFVESGEKRQETNYAFNYKCTNFLIFNVTPCVFYPPCILILICPYLEWYCVYFASIMYAFCLFVCFFFLFVCLFYSPVFEWNAIISKFARISNSSTNSVRYQCHECAKHTKVPTQCIWSRSGSRVEVTGNYPEAILESSKHST